MDRAEINKDWEPYLPPPSANAAEAEEISRAIEVLARVVQILDIPDASYASYSTAINKLTEKHLSSSRSVLRLRRIEEELTEHLAVLQHESALIKHWNKAPLTSDAPESASALKDVPVLEKQREVMLRKAKEYHRGVERMTKERPIDLRITLAQLISQKEKNLSREKDIEEKRARLRAFQGLPPNLELARHELRSARQRQMELVKLRERLLRKMAEGVE